MRETSIVLIKRNQWVQSHYNNRIVKHINQLYQAATLPTIHFPSRDRDPHVSQFVSL